MPAKDYNEYMSKYMLSRYYERMRKAIEQLGGCCSLCGSTTNLEIDHIDPSQKGFNLSKGHSFSEERWQAELKKCQVLCEKCHLRKTVEEGSLSKGEHKQKKITHGTVWTYSRHGCRCDTCKLAKSVYEKQRKKNKAPKL